MAAHPTTPTLSTHVLDTATGQPAAGVPVDVTCVLPAGDRAAGSGVTNADGRIPDLLPGGLAAGTYRLSFDVGAYRHASGAADAFFSRFSVEVVITDLTRGYHIPLLLAPFGCTTYRGS